MRVARGDDRARAEGIIADGGIARIDEGQAKRTGKGTQIGSLRAPVDADENVVGAHTEFFGPRHGGVQLAGRHADIDQKRQISRISWISEVGGAWLFAKAGPARRVR